MAQRQLSMTGWRVLDIGFVGIVSDDPSVAAFYQEALGLRLLDADDTFVYLTAGAEAKVEILASDTTTARQQRADAPSLGFLVNNPDLATQTLRDRGVVCGPVAEWRSTSEVHRWCYLTDPADNTLLLVERNTTSTEQ